MGQPEVDILERGSVSRDFKNLKALADQRLVDGSNISFGYLQIEMIVSVLENRPVESFRQELSRFFSAIRSDLELQIGFQQRTDKALVEQTPFIDDGDPVTNALDFVQQMTGKKNSQPTLLGEINQQLRAQMM